VLDEDLLRYATVWAAAGTPNTVFAVAPAALATATDARVGRLADR
jgi:prolyl-tRNA editing enzyme YbaK/EbsC (Cys-tRNA(Pro) deacylase)